MQGNQGWHNRQGQPARQHAPFPTQPQLPPQHNVHSYSLQTPSSAGGSAGRMRQQYTPYGVRSMPGGAGGPVVRTETDSARGDVSLTPKSPRTEMRKREAKDRVFNQLFAKHLDSAPAEMKASIVTLMHIVEDMYWAYMDDYISSPTPPPDHEFLDPFAKTLLQGFTYEVLVRRPALVDLWPEVPRGGLDCGRDEPNKRDASRHFHKLLCDHKRTVPMAGAVILNQQCDQVLLVKAAYGGASWQFPKGKCARLKKYDGSLAHERPPDCAVREVLMQTGVDITPFIGDAELVEHKITRRGEVSMAVSLYVVVLPSDALQPKLPPPEARIAELEWHSWARLTAAAAGTGGSDHSKYEVLMRYVHPLGPRIAALKEKLLVPPVHDWTKSRRKLLAEWEEKWPTLKGKIDPFSPVRGCSQASAEKRLALVREFSNLLPAQPPAA
eukprot:Hpha_TRINITY_DN15056_c0_g9::TRINITY_DN15056_c0_g9_i1::g.126111::m.126111/K12613/DCP2; mRNA-decapping enzyme subunit 2